MSTVLARIGLILVEAHVGCAGCANVTRESLGRSLGDPINIHIIQGGAAVPQTGRVANPKTPTTRTSRQVGHSESLIDWTLKSQASQVWWL
jgi:hypothetical protein